MGTSLPGLLESRRPCWKVRPNFKFCLNGIVVFSGGKNVVFSRRKNVVIGSRRLRYGKGRLTLYRRFFNSA